MANKLSYSKTFYAGLIAGVTTGMGNGSVFGAALMCALGRGRFDHAGLFGAAAYNPAYFQGFVDWCMLIFGFAFMIIVLMALYRHGELESGTA